MEQRGAARTMITDSSQNHEYILDITEKETKWFEEDESATQNANNIRVKDNVRGTAETIWTEDVCMEKQFDKKA